MTALGVRPPEPDGFRGDRRLQGAYPCCVI